jgi:hypothetical protein
VKRIVEDKLALVKADIFSNAVLPVCVQEAILANDIDATKVLLNGRKLTNILSFQEVSQLLFDIVRNSDFVNMLKFILNYNGVNVDKYRSLSDKSSLLGEASFYGSVESVKLLLELGSDPNYKDNKQITPLHKASVRGNIEIIKSLLSHNAAINVTNIAGFTPLYLAIIHKKNDVKNELIRNGASMKIKTKNGDDGISLAKQVILLNTSAPPAKFESIVKPNLLQKANANYYKGVLSEKHREDYLIESMNNYKTFIEDLPNTKENVEQKVAYITQMMNIFIIVKFEGSEHLRDYIINNFKLYKAHNLVIVMYNNICSEYISEQNYDLAKQSIELAYNYYKGNSLSIEKTVIGEMFFNYGESLRNSEHSRALTYFAESQKYLPYDEDTIINKCVLLINLANYTKALVVVNEIRDRELLDLLTMQILIHQQESPIKEILSKYDYTRFDISKLDSQKKVTLYNDLSFAINLYSRDFAKANEITHLINVCDQRNIPKQLLQTLAIYQATNQWKEGLDFLNKTYSLYPKILDNHKILGLTYYEFLFYTVNQLYDKASQTFEKLSTYADTELGAKLYEVAQELITTDLILSEPGFKEKDVYLLKNIDPSNQDKVHLLQKYLTNSKDTYEPNSLNTTYEQSFATIDWFEDPKVLKEELEKYDPRAIHTFYQKKKQDLIQKGVPYLKREICYSWKVDGKLIFSNDSNIYEVHGKNGYYSTIDPELLSSLDKSTQERIINSLDKGYSHGFYGKNGIKVIDSIPELKINEDLRLYTILFYHNKEDKHLIYFDKKGSHTKISKVAKTSKLQVIDVPSATTEEQTYHDAVIQCVSKHGAVYESPLFRNDENLNDITLAGISNNEE